MNSIEYLYIGHIANTFGLKGELKVVSESDFIDFRYKVGNKIFIKYANKYIEVIITSCRIQKGNVIITINHLFDINDVEKYIGADIYCDKNNKPILNDGEYLIDDLVSKKVYLENNTYFGIVNDVLILPSNKVLEIKKENNEIYLLPFIKDYVINIDENIVIKLCEVEVC